MLVNQSSGDRGNDGLIRAVILDDQIDRAAVDPAGLVEFVNSQLDAGRYGLAVSGKDPGKFRVYTDADRVAG